MNRWILPMKVFAYAVVLLMGAAMLYAAAITIMHWPAINV